LVSIGRKMLCGESSMMNDWMPSDTDELGMQPKGLTGRVLLTFEYATFSIVLATVWNRADRTF